MQCPECENVGLTMSERQGIEIDYCPKCRGVWLDRGEIDKIIEKTGQPQQAAVPAHPDSRRVYKDDHDGYGNHKHKRKSFLHELFD